MVIGDNVTFRRKRRYVLYGALLLIVIAAVVAAVSIAPAHTDGAGAGTYQVVDGTGTKTYYTTDEVFSYVNSSASVSPITIIIFNDIPDFPGYTLNYNKDITVKSSPGNQFKLTITKTNIRHFVADGNFTLENIILDGNTTGGGVRHTSATGSLTMNYGAVIQNCSAGAGGGVYTIGTFTMNNGAVIKNCYSYQDGGGVYFNPRNYPITFTMNGGEIIGNTATGWGGGVFNTGGILNMKGGVISNNKADAGGGIYGTATNASITISGSAVISKNEAYSGGGVLFTIRVSFTMNGGQISDNIATDRGGGVYNDYANFTLNGGTISGNTSNMGGGVYIVGSNSTSAMSGGVISGNTATMGGGIYSSTTLNITGGTFSGNKANGTSINGSGGAIFVLRYTELIVGDGVVFSGNTAPTLRTQNIAVSSADLANYLKNISPRVVLSAPVNPDLNAPAYNNYDINYSSPYIVFIDIEPNGDGTVAVSDSATGDIYDVVVVDGRTLVYVPITVKSITLLATSGSGYEFIRFVIGGSGVGENPAVFDVSWKMTVLAEFKQKEYIITYHMNGGNSDGPAEESVVDGIHQLSGIVPTHYKVGGSDILFVGWSLTPAGIIDKDGEPSVMVTSVTVSGAGVTMYAVWAYDANNNGTPDYKEDQHAVVYNSNGGADGPAEKSVIDGTHPLSGVVPTHDKVGESSVFFIGWSLTQAGIIGKDGEPPVTVTSVTVSGAGITVYAVWAYDANNNGTPDYKEDQHSIIYDANDGTGAPDADTGLITGTYDLSKKVPTHAKINGNNVLFLGWSLTKIDVLNLGDEVPELITAVEIVNDNVIVYAVWGTDGIDTGGSGGSGSDTGSGGNGTSTGGSGGSGSDTGTGGSDTEAGVGGETVEAGPTTHANGEWSVLSLIFAIAAIFTGMIAVIAGRDRFGTDSGERMSIIRIDLRVLALIIGIVSAIIFFLTENWSLTPTAMGTWTPLMFILLIATLILAMVSFRFDKADS